MKLCANRSFAVVNPRNRLNFPDDLPVSLLFVGGKTGRNPALSTLPLVSTSPAKINIRMFLEQNISKDAMTHEKRNRTARKMNLFH